jgi:hypothetical protein
MNRNSKKNNNLINLRSKRTKIAQKIKEIINYCKMSQFIRRKRLKLIVLA